MRQNVKRLAIVAATAAMALASGSVMAMQANRSSQTPKTGTMESGVLAPHTNVSLVDAIAAAEKASHGIAVSARSDMRNGSRIYVVKTYYNNAVWENSVDASSGLVYPINRMGKLSRDDRLNVAQLHKVKSITLAEAVQRAEKISNGTAISGELAPSKHKEAYKIDVEKSGMIQSLHLNPAGAQITSG